METSPKDVVLTFVHAVNTQDIKALEDLMAPRHRFIDSLGKQIEGRESVRSRWVDYLRLVLDYTIEVQETFVHGPVVVLLGQALGSYTVDGKLTPQERWCIPAAFRAFVDDGKIVEWRIFADHDPLRTHLRKCEESAPRAGGSAA